MIWKFLTRIFGSRQQRDLRRYWPRADVVNDEFAKLESLSDDDLRGKTDEFRRRLEEGETVVSGTYQAIRELEDGALVRVEGQGDQTGPSAEDSEG